MTFESFAWWLRGALEISGVRALTLEEVTLINQHLSLLFVEVAKTLPATKQVSSIADLEKALEVFPTSDFVTPKLC